MPRLVINGDLRQSWELPASTDVETVLTHLREAMSGRLKVMELEALVNDVPTPILINGSQVVSAVVVGKTESS